MSYRRRLPPLSALRAFEAAARHLSFQQAAAELALTPTAISHAVRRLEAELGQPLFARHPKGVRLTLAGDRLAATATVALDMLAAAAREASGSAPGVILTATHAFTAHWLTPRLRRLSEAIPQERLSLLASDDVAPLRPGRVDLAVRFALAPPGPEARSLFDEHATLLAAPTLGLRALEDAAHVPRIVFQWRSRNAPRLSWRDWSERAGGPRALRGPELHFNEEAHAIQAALAGEGAVLAGRRLLSAQIAAGHLVAPFAASLAAGGYYLLSAPGAGAASAALSEALIALAAA